MNIIIVGGGKVGYYLVKTLRTEHKVTLIEKDKQVCREIANELGVTVIHGDGSDLSILEDAGASKTDVLVAATGRDQDNLVTCQIVSSHFSGIRTIARVNNPKNEKAIEKLGVDVAISSTSIISQLIEKEVTAEDLITLMTFEQGNMAIVELELPPDSPVKDKKIMDISSELPDDSVLVSIIRRGKVIFPRGQTVLKEGDSIIAVTSLDKEDELDKALTGKN